MLASLSDPPGFERSRSASPLALTMEPTPPLRAVLLGASNLQRGLALGLDLLARTSGAPVEAWVAAGRGRSFGTASRFAFVRRLPGIVESPLWREVAALPHFPERPPLALVTDVGNDLLYGAPVATILRWVSICLDRLEGMGARTAVTLLPLPRLERLTPLQFQTFATLLYPGRRASWAETLDRARGLDAGLSELARSRGLPVVAPPLDWYGLDPIHVRRDRQGESWSEVLRAWGLAARAAAGPARNAGGRREWRLRGLPFSSETRLFGLPCPWPQPALRGRDGSRAFLL